MLDGAVEAARLLGNVQGLAWDLFNRAFAALAAGDVETGARDRGGERRADANAGRQLRLGAAAVGARRARCSRAGDADAPPSCSSRSPEARSCRSIPAAGGRKCLELLTRCLLAARAARGGRSEPPRRRRRAPTPSALPMADRDGGIAPRPRSRSTAGDPATRRRAGARLGGALPRRSATSVDAAVSRTLAGRALAQAGRAATRPRPSSSAPPRRFDAFGAVALPRRGRARAAQARPPHPPPHAARARPTGPASTRSPSASSRSRGSSSTARRTPRSPPRCSSARRPSRRTSATCSASSSVTLARRARARRRASDRAGRERLAGIRRDLLRPHEVAGRAAACRPRSG